MKGFFPQLLSATLLTAVLNQSAADNLTVLLVKEIETILKERCVHYHNRKTLPEQVSFESAELAFTKTPEGLSVIVPGKPKESLMITALASARIHAKVMPQTGMRPTAEEIGKLRLWILEGAKWPKGLMGRIRPTFHPTE